MQNLKEKRYMKKAIRAISGDDYNVSFKMPEVDEACVEVTARHVGFREMYGTITFNLSQTDLEALLESITKARGFDRETAEAYMCSM
jgi:hypothetical protein